MAVWSAIGLGASKVFKKMGGFKTLGVVLALAGLVFMGWRYGILDQTNNYLESQLERWEDFQESQDNVVDLERKTSEKVADVYEKEKNLNHRGFAEYTNRVLNQIFPPKD